MLHDHRQVPIAIGIGFYDREFRCCGSMCLGICGGMSLLINKDFRIFKKGWYERFDWIIISVDNNMFMVDSAILKIFIQWCEYEDDLMVCWIKGLIEHVFTQQQECISSFF